MTNPLWGHWLRIKRANEHKSALHQTIAAFIDAQPYTVGYEFHSKSSEVGITVGRVNPTDDDKAVLEWGIAVGDIVHQLRAALDNLVFTLTELTSKPLPAGRRNPMRDVGFPIVSDASSWSEAMARQLWGVPEETLALFRDVQPFVTGKSGAKREPLAVLHKLWNVDKHRAIPLLAIDLVLPQIADLPPQLGFKQTFQYTGPLEDGKEVLRLSYPVETGQRKVASQLDHYLRYTFEVAFDQMPPWIPNRPLIIKTLELCENATQAIFLKFDPYFP